MVFVPITRAPKFPFHFEIHVIAKQKKNPSPCLLRSRKRTLNRQAQFCLLNFIYDRVWGFCIVTQALKRAVETCLEKNSFQLCPPFGCPTSWTLHGSTPTSVSFLLLWTVKAGFYSTQCLFSFAFHFYAHIKQVWNVEADESKQKILSWVLCPLFNRNRKQSCAPYKK